jgi:hypothetical protein
MFILGGLVPIQTVLGISSVQLLIKSLIDLFEHLDNKFYPEILKNSKLTECFLIEGRFPVFHPSIK